MDPWVNKLSWPWMHSQMQVAAMWLADYIFALMSSSASVPNQVDSECI